MHFRIEVYFPSMQCWSQPAATFVSPPWALSHSYICGPHKLSTKVQPKKKSAANVKMLADQNSINKTPVWTFSSRAAHRSAPGQQRKSCLFSDMVQQAFVSHPLPRAPSAARSRARGSGPAAGGPWRPGWRSRCACAAAPVHGDASRAQSGRRPARRRRLRRRDGASRRAWRRSPAATSSLQSTTSTSNRISSGPRTYRSKVWSPTSSHEVCHWKITWKGIFTFPVTDLVRRSLNVVFISQTCREKTKGACEDKKRRRHGAKGKGKGNEGTLWLFQYENDEFGIFEFVLLWFCCFGVGNLSAKGPLEHSDSIFWGSEFRDLFSLPSNCVCVCLCVCVRRGISLHEDATTPGWPQPQSFHW